MSLPQESPAYSVVHEGGNKLKFVDMRTGAVVGRTSFNGIGLAGSPIVSGDTCTVIAQLQGDRKMGYVIKLPSGAIVDSFHA